MATCAEYQSMLTDALAALHSLQLGGKVKLLQHGDKRIEYTVANLSDLHAHIAWLQGKVDACSGTARANRVLRFVPTDG